MCVVNPGGFFSNITSSPLRATIVPASQMSQQTKVPALLPKGAMSSSQNALNVVHYFPNCQHNPSHCLPVMLAHTSQKPDSDLGQKVFHVPTRDTTPAYPSFSWKGFWFAEFDSVSFQEVFVLQLFSLLFLVIQSLKLDP